MSNLETVRSIYDAIDRGDVPAILEKLAENVTWEYPKTSTEVPWLQQRMGRENVAEAFVALGGITVDRFELRDLLEGDGVVIALADLAFTVNETGK